MAVAASSLAAVGTTAHADALDGRRLTFGGFGTLAGDYSFAHRLEYRSAAGEPDDADPHHLEFATDSVLGLQLNAAWNRELEVVVQAASRNSADHRWRPRLTRGFLRYTPDEAIMLRGGRIGYEFFPRADSRDVGYSYLTLRPPVEMFGQLPNEDFDGADLTLTQPLARGLARLKLFGGAVSGNLVQPDGSHVNLAGSRIWGAQAAYLRGPWAAQAGVGWYLVGHPPSLAALSAGLRQTGQPQAIDLANRFDEKGRRVAIYSAALTYDQGPWQARLYLVRTDTGSPIGPSENLGQFTVGYAFGKFTPFVLLSRGQNYAAVRSTGLPSSPQTEPLIEGAYLAQTYSQTNQSTAAIGLRYDFAPHMDLKLQVDRVWEQGSEMVLDRNVPPVNHGDLTVVGAALDFVF